MKTFALKKTVLSISIVMGSLVINQNKSLASEPEVGPVTSFAIKVARTVVTSLLGKAGDAAFGGKLVGSQPDDIERREAERREQEKKEKELQAKVEKKQRERIKTMQTPLQNLQPKYKHEHEHIHLEHPVDFGGHESKHIAHDFKNTG